MRTPEQIIEQETERVKKEIAKQLNEICSGKGFSKRKFAKTTYTHSSTNSNLLNAKNNCTLKSLVKAGVYNNYRVEIKFHAFNFETATGQTNLN